MFVTSGFPPNATDETSELPRSSQRKYLRSFIKEWLERNQAKDLGQAWQAFARHYRNYRSIIESDSSFHRAKLAQGDEGINPGQQKMRPVVFPTLPEGL
jgi:hypothetical protein